MEVTSLLLGNKKIVNEHETQIKSIAEQGAQKLEKLEKVYRAEYTRIKNAQRTLIDEADGIKKAVLANSDDIPEAILREATISVPNGNTEALTTCTNPFDVNSLSTFKNQYTTSEHNSRDLTNGQGVKHGKGGEKLKSKRDSVRFSLPSANSTCFTVNTEDKDDDSLVKLNDSGSSQPVNTGRGLSSYYSNHNNSTREDGNSSDKHAKKPSMFSGAKNDWLQWKSVFLHYAKLAKIADHDVIHTLLTYLMPGEYRKVESLNLSDEEYSDMALAFAKIDPVLAKPFSAMGTRLQLGSLRQGSDSVSKFAEIVRDMVMMGDYTPEVRETLCLQYFIAGLEEDGDAINLLQRNPPIAEFDVAVKECIRRSLARKARSAVRKNLTQQNLQEKVLAIKESSERAIISQQQMFENMKLEIEQLKEQFRESQLNRRPQRSRSEIICWNCWESGHLASQCKNPKRPELQDVGPGGPQISGQHFQNQD